MTETATVETPEVIISDGSHLAEGVGVKLKNAVERSREADRPGTLLSGSDWPRFYVGIASERALMRTFVLLRRQ